MNSFLPVGKFLSKMRSLFPLWLALTVTAGILILLLELITLPNKGTVSAAVNLSYDGIETGRDPAGNRFDPQEMKNDTVLQDAAAAVGVTLESEEELARVRQAIDITGMVPEGTLTRITEYTSRYQKDEQEQTAPVSETAYFPTRYTILLHYRDAGFSAKEGREFLSAMLESYRAYFFRRYGYNTSFEEAIPAVDYSDYDYPDALDVLDISLGSLSSYLSWLSSQNNERFISPTTGYSFADLVEAIQTLRQEDIGWFSSYIEYNGITKDRNELLYYYRYRIESDERLLASYQANLETLNQTIAGYVKTNAMVLSVGMSGGVSGYEVSQQSETYNSLVNRRITSQNNISELNEEIRRYQVRISLLEAETRGDISMLEQFIQNLDSQTRQLVSYARTTGMEYFEMEKLRGAYQVVREVGRGASLFGWLKRSILMSVSLGLVFFALYMLLCFLCVRFPERTAIVERTAGRFGALAGKRQRRRRGQKKEAVPGEDAAAPTEPTEPTEENAPAYEALPDTVTV